MQKFRTKTAITILYGHIKLDDRLAARHQASLQIIDDGIYEVVGKVQLKAGTVFEYQGEESRAFMDSLQIISDGDEPGDAAARKAKRGKP